MAQVKPVGIHCMHAYCGVASLDVDDIFTARGLDQRRKDNLLMVSKSVALPCEDAVTFAVNAAAPLLAGLTEQQRNSIGLLFVATESGLDYSKSIAAWAHGLLGLSRNCQLLEMKQACDSGISAVRLACSALRSGDMPGAMALVIAVDLPWVLPGTYIEPSQGAGAVAVLIGTDPQAIAVEPSTSGWYSFDTPDFLRPLPDTYLWDIDLSMLCYLECLKGAFTDYRRERSAAEVLEEFDFLVMHAPFPGMVRGGHRALLRSTGQDDKASQRLRPDQLDQDFWTRAGPSVGYQQQVGNIYAATTLLGLAGVLDKATPGARGKVGIFSYGSGCSSQFLSVTLCSSTPQPRTNTADALSDRARLTIDEYDALLEHSGPTVAGVRDATLDLDHLAHYLKSFQADRADRQPLLVLEEVRNHRRRYTWLE